MMKRNKMTRAQWRAYRKKVAAGACCLALVGSNIVVPGGMSQFFMGGYTVMAASAVVDENTIMVDFSSLPIVDGKIIYTITENGTYCLSGNNLRNEVRVPAQVIVAKGVEVNLILDGLDITNVDGYYGGCGMGDVAGTTPILINGRAAVTVLQDSVISGYYQAGGAIIIAENASLSIEESEHMLTVTGSDDSTSGIRVQGSFSMNGGNIVATGGNYAPGIFPLGEKSQVIINDGSVIAKGGWYATGIGNHGQGTTSGTITINGGSVQATGGEYTAGIGNGREDQQFCKKITITGGFVQATGGERWGTGIGNGGGYGSSCEGIFISGGTVIAKKSYNVPVDIGLTGIGECSAPVVITGGNVTGTTNRAYTTNGEKAVLARTIQLTDILSKTNIYGITAYAKDTSGTITNTYKYGTNDMITDETGKLSLYLTEDVTDIDIITEDTQYLGYSGAISGDTAVISGDAVQLSKSYTPKKVIYINSDDSSCMGIEYANQKGVTRLLSNTPEYDYSFYVEENVFDGTGITEDTEVSVVKSRHEYTITYTGDYEGSSIVYYGESTTLPTGEAVENLLFLNENGTIFTGQNITRDITVTAVKGIRNETGSYYTISTEVELQNFRDKVNNGMVYLNGMLMADVDVRGVEMSWLPIANTSTCCYRGTFDGQGHQVTLDILEDGFSTQARAFFGYLGDGCVIKNLRTAGTIEMYGKYPGGIAGSVPSAGKVTMQNCGSSMNIIYTPGGDVTAGGMLGLNAGDVVMENCYYRGSMQSGPDGEALVGQGGLLGWNNGTLKANNCYVSAAFTVGENAGENFSRNGAQLTNCYYLNVCGNSTQGTAVTVEELMSAKMAWNLNTTNGATTNSAVWSEGHNTGSQFADGEHKAVYRVSLLQDGIPYADSPYLYTKADGTLSLSDATPEGYEFSGWLADGQTVSATTVFSADTVLNCEITETVSHAKSRLQVLCNAAPSLENYTTKSAQNYMDAKAHAVDIIANADTNLDQVTQAIQSIQDATDGLWVADGTVTLSSAPTATGVLSGGGKYATSDSVTITADAVTGYNFTGWYDSADQLVSSNRVYNFIYGGEDMALTAKYESLGDIALVVNPGGNFTVNGSTKTSLYTQNWAKGSIITLVADNTDGTFAYWADSNGMVVSKDPEYTFTFGETVTLNSVYNKIIENKTTVIFLSASGQVISRDEYDTTTASITIPDAPSKKGYSFTGWSMSQDTIKAALEEQRVITVTPIYIQNSETYTVIVSGGSITRSTTEAEEGKYKVGTNLTLTADAAPSGQKFSHWKDADGNVLSYSNEYYMKVTADTSVSAVFVAEVTKVEAKPTIVITSQDAFKVNEVIKASFTATRDIPDSFTLISQGIVATTDDNTAGNADSFVIGGNNVKKATGSATDNKGILTVNIKTAASVTWYARGYVIYKDADGNQYTVYSDVESVAYTAD